MSRYFVSVQVVTGKLGSFKLRYKFVTFFDFLFAYQYLVFRGIVFGRDEKCSTVSTASTISGCIFLLPMLMAALFFWSTLTNLLTKLTDSIFQPVDSQHFLYSSMLLTSKIAALFITPVFYNIQLNI